MYDAELAVALQAVRQACRVCNRVQSSFDLGALTKTDRSPVTVADFAAQAVIAKALGDAFPDDALVAEERSDALREAAQQELLQRAAALSDMAPETLLASIDRGSGQAAERFWTLDPVDGTKGFLRSEHYAVALALIERGRVVLGVLGCPRLPLQGAGIIAAGDGVGSVMSVVAGERPMLWDETGTSATPVRTSSERDLQRMRACESVESGHSKHDVAASVAQELGIQSAVRVDGQVKYALVARGDADVYWRLPTRADYREKIWDHAAGAAIVEAAGGKVTDIDGRPLDFGRGTTLSANRGIIASNGLAHDAIVAAVARRF